MAQYQLSYNSTTKVATIQPNGASVPSGSTLVGSFYHGNSQDSLSVGRDNHSWYDHVKDMLGRIKKWDLQNVKIVLSGINQTALGPNTVAIPDGTNPGDSLTAITGLADDEEVISITPNDGRVILNRAGNALIKGISRSTRDRTYLLTTDKGRSFEVVVTIGTVVVTLPSFAPEAETLAFKTASVAASVPVADSRLYTANRMIKALKAAGVWAKAKGFYLLAADAEAQALINWKSPGTNDLTKVGNPVFVQYDGYTTGSNASYFETNIAITALSLNDCAIAMFSKTSAAAGTADMGALDGSNGLLILSKTTNAQATMRAMGAGVTPGVAAQWDGYGLHVSNRPNATTAEFYHNGALVASTAQASVALTGSNTIAILKANGGTSASGQKIAFAYVGQSLTAAQVAAMHSAVNSYLEQIQYGDLVQFDPGVAPTTATYDAVFYGATIGSLTAAIAAKKAGKNVAIVGGWRERRIGGMSAGGLGFTDYVNEAGLGGLARDIITDMNSMASKANTVFRFEPRLFSRAMYKRLTDRAGGYGIPIYWSNGLQTVTKSGTRITAIKTVDGRTFNASYFGDGSYESDLARASGLTVVTGRDAAGTGVEAKAGYRGLTTTDGSNKHQFLVNVSPYVTDGDNTSGLLPGVHANPNLTVGSQETRTEAYNIRMIWTNNGARKIPFSSVAPRNYNKQRYELLLREMAQRTTAGATPAIGDIFLVNQPGLDIAGTANGGAMFDVNSWGGLASDLWDSGTNYVAAGMNQSQREAVYQDYLDYINGLIYLLAYDTSEARVPASLRTAITAYGWDSRHFTDPYPGDALYMPTQFYVRSHTRIVGDFVLDANDVAATDGSAPRSTKTISTISYAMDGHHNQMIVDTSVNPARVWNTGNIEATSGGTDSIAPVPYEAMLPKRTECTNLAMLWSGSMSCLAFSAARMEFTYGQIGQSMGLAIKQAIDAGNQALQDVDYPTLRTAILGAGDTATPVLPQTN